MGRGLSRLFCCCVAAIATAADYDLLVRGGRIVDGTGNPWFYGDLARTLKPGGRAVVSGFSSEQAPPLSEMFASKGLAPAGRRVHDGWACLILETLL